MVRSFLFLFWMLLQATAFAGPPRSIVVLGDSLSAGYGVPVGEGWAHLLQARLDAGGYSCGVVNASVTGDTTSGGLARLPGLLAREDAAVVIIELGGNDGLRGITPRVTAANLRQMIGVARAAGAATLLLGVELPANYGTDFRALFHAAYYEVAEGESVPLVPSFLEGVAMEPQLMQSDGIHPNAAAQPLMLDTVWPALEPLLESAGCGNPGLGAGKPGPGV